ncbi:MAG: hypothetical protein LT106_02545 [Burkholderiaceae bacterium]|nr:hypothetical protein [Burkholderiaceae bacterium]
MVDERGVPQPREALVLLLARAELARSSTTVFYDLRMTSLLQTHHAQRIGGGVLRI